MTLRHPAPPITDAALLALHNLNTILGDPAVTYVTVMTAAAISGHMIERTREQMHETLDQVFDVALAKMLAVTEPRQ